MGEDAATTKPLTTPGRVGALVGIVVLAALLLATSLFAATRRGVWDPDEPRYAEVAREMLEANDLAHYVVPHIDGREYTAKPPLLFWAEVASSRLTGGEITAVSARIPSALAGLVVFLATAALGFRLLGPRGGVAAALALLAEGQFLWQSSIGQIDQVLAAFETAGLACLVFALFPRGGRPRGLAAAGLALLGIGVLAKGPVSVIVPLLVLATVLGVGRMKPRLGWEWAGLAAGLVPVLAWFVAAGRLGSREYAATIGWKETVVRYFAVESHRISAPALWAHFLGGVLPATLFLVPAAGEAIRAEKHARRFGSALADRLPTLLPLAWLAATLVFFSFSRGKRSVYLVPAFPAVALLIGWYVVRPRGSTSRVWLGFESTVGWVLIVLAALLVPAVEIAEGFIPWIDWELEPLHLRPEAAVLAIVLFAVGVLAVLKSRAWLVVLAVGTVVGFGVLHVRVVPGFDPAKSAQRTAERFVGVMAPGSEWAMIGEEQEGILFYSRKRIEHFTLDDPGINALHAWFKGRAGKPSYLIVKDRNDDTVKEHFPELGEVVRCRVGESLFLLKGRVAGAR